jgi:glutaredoxin 3
MPEITIYTTRSCPYCHAAKTLLDRKQAAFKEIDVSSDPVTRAEMTRKAGGRYTVPQIWIGATHVGGCDDLYALDSAGQLDVLLAAEAP